MARNTKQTSKTVATKASQILKDGRYGSKAKSVDAGSKGALSMFARVAALELASNDPALQTTAY